ncbi:hemerythrin domain-containing protein [Cellulomonas sp. McL0617]|uniref:hemerythrin domain-containing protein n=1 Tax=Cellulomonas sp. McL0617 TaxID=3415675 RepID=UPI003CFB6786
MVDFYAPAPGETAPPVPDGPALCSGKEMRVLHNAFLWAYAEAPGLVRGAAAGDTRRSAVVGQWLADLDATLHVHHQSEDELLWDKLEQRAPSCALHVAQMRAHHAQVQELLHEASPLLERWQVSGDPSDGEDLAVAYERMLDVLKVHLRREVLEVVPVAEKTLTQREWNEVGEHSIGAIPKSRLMPQLGMLLANTEPTARAEFFEGVPKPVQLLYRIVGRRQYARQYRELFPGRPVPATV